MTRNEKDTINRRTENRHLFQRMKRGLESVRDTPHKRVLLAAYLIGAVLVWLFRAYLFGLDTYGMFSPVLEAVINLLLVLLGTPWGGKAAREGLQKVGLVNHAGEAPPLIAKRQDTDNPRLTVWEFDPCGIPLGEWEDKRARIETALNITIAKMTWAEGRKIICVYAAPAAESDFLALLPWKDKYLSPDNVLKLLLIVPRGGESLRAGPGGSDGQPYESELLDRTGRSKEDRDKLNQIENRLATLARLGRAFGIHLILATQRPDANILPGQIKNNMDFRVCGRAESVLSGIILDNTSAAEQIPKDARGRFITGDGLCSKPTIWRAYKHKSPFFGKSNDNL